MKIATIVGARPQFIKAAPINRAIQAHNRKGGNCRITEILVHTGQHYDHNMSQIFFDQLKIPCPQYNLGVGSGKHGEMTGLMLAKIEAVLLEENPDFVIVYGDTNSTLAGALASAKLNIPLAHIEAGLRSYNRRMPEEINRVVTDHVSTLLFCPTETAVGNLRNEGVTKGVVNVGDVMYDAFLFNKNLSDKNSRVLSQLGLEPGSYCLATVHRQENTDDGARLQSIFSAFNELATRDLPFILLLHPRTKKALERQRGDYRFGLHLRLLSPASYLDMIALETHAKVILTDSGGVQKEAYFSKVPCITLRDETEWVETVDAGWNRIAGADRKRIISIFEKANAYGPNGRPDAYGDGKAGELIIKHLVSAHIGSDEKRSASLTGDTRREMSSEVRK